MKRATQLRKQRDSAIKIQAAARGYIAYTSYVFALIDIIFCQAIVRSKLARIQKLKLRNAYVSYEKAASCIQDKWRSYAVNKRVYSIVMVQTFVRRHIARKRFAKIKAYDACRNRALIRTKERSAAVIIQTCWEEFKVRRLHTCATSIQRKWRAHMNCLRNKRSVLQSVVLIQAVMRRALTERRIAAALRCVAISESDNIKMVEQEASIILQRWWEKQSYMIRMQKSSSFDLSVQVHHAAAAMIVSRYDVYIHSLANMFLRYCII